MDAERKSGAGINFGINMLRYFTKRLIRSVFVLYVLITIVFFVIQFAPGDPAMQALGSGASPEKIQAVRHSYGLDKPMVIQYLDYLGAIINGSFGKSWRSGIPVSEQLIPRLINTLKLASVAMIMASLLGLFVGTWSATRWGKNVDHLIKSISLVGISVPVFVICFFLIYVFAFKLNLFPTQGADKALSIFLPAFSLCLFVGATMIRLIRAALLNVLNKDYIKSLRAKGFSEKVVYKVALRNASVEIITIIGLQFGMLFGGSVITETVFSWPGLGRLIVQAALSNDLPVMAGAIIFFAALFMLLNLTVDFIYPLLDPRIVRD